MELLIETIHWLATFVSILVVIKGLDNRTGFLSSLGEPDRLVICEFTFIAGDLEVVEVKDIDQSDIHFSNNYFFDVYRGDASIATYYDIKTLLSSKHRHLAHKSWYEPERRGKML